MRKYYFSNFDEPNKDLAFTEYSTYSLKDAASDNGDWED